MFALMAMATTLVACQSRLDAGAAPTGSASSVDNEAEYAATEAPPYIEPAPAENEDLAKDTPAPEAMQAPIIDAIAREKKKKTAGAVALGSFDQGGAVGGEGGNAEPASVTQGIVNGPSRPMPKPDDASRDRAAHIRVGDEIALDGDGYLDLREIDGRLDVDDFEDSRNKRDDKPDAYRSSTIEVSDKKERRSEEKTVGSQFGQAGKKRTATMSGSVTVDTTGIDAMRYVRPDRVLPRTFYFENTYLGGSAAYAERLRKLDAALGEGERPYRLVVAESQPFDPPRTDGLSLHASVDATHFDDPRRVFLQVGIQGSQRYGWRRPPIDAMLVLDHVAFAAGPRAVIDFIAAALRRLDHTDRLGVLIAGPAGVEEVLALTRLDTARQALAHRIDTLSADPQGGSHLNLSDAMRRAGEILSRASESPNTIPGTQMVLILSGATSADAVRAATAEAHTLTVQGAVTSIFTSGGDALPWWQLADAGYGNWHRLDEVGPEQAFTDELAALARVVARLIRVNIRLGKGAHAVRVLGTRILEAKEVERVKAREVAADRNLSKTMGISADRGDDDDGIQTVIPYFLGDDSHVILVELWLDEPGVVADVSLRYKDMVNLENAAARTSVRIGSRPQPEAPEQEWITRNVHGFLLGEELQRASLDVHNGAFGSASAAIQRAQEYARHTNEDDSKAMEQMETMINERNVAPAVMRDNLLMSGQRRIGTTLR